MFETTPVLAGLRAVRANRRVKNATKSAPLRAVPPSKSARDFDPSLADLAAHILYRSPLPSQNDLRVYIINAAAFPDTNVVDYDALLPYVLARLPDEDELIGGKGYEVVFFASGEAQGATSVRKGRPGWGWFLQAYHVLSRAMRKRLQTLYIVHEKRWIRVMVELFSTVVSLKFRKKIMHISSLTGLALHMPIEDLLIPPSTYICDRWESPEIHVPYATGTRAFGMKTPLPLSKTGTPRLPRVLRETTSFLLLDKNLKTEGLFRVSPRSSTLDILKESYNRAQKFIVWREADTVLAFPHWKEGFGEVNVEELDSAEGFEVHDAAGLVKMWYLQLREPVFPQSSYVDLLRTFGDEQRTIETDALLDLIAPIAASSPLSIVSRLILTQHLIPLLACVSEQHESNKMTSHNLAVCFAPSLLRGPDPMEDVTVAGVLRRVLELMIDRWNTQLAGRCGMNKEKFQESLRLPAAIEDREDDFEQAPTAPRPRQGQIEGIVLVNNDGVEVENNGEVGRPPLPPRRNSPQSPVSESPTDSEFVRRKPAPSVRGPPRYSTIFSQDDNLDALPAYESYVGIDDSDPLGPVDGRFNRQPMPLVEDPTIVDHSGRAKSRRTRAPVTLSDVNETVTDEPRENTRDPLGPVDDRRNRQSMPLVEDPTVVDHSGRVKSRRTRVPVTPRYVVEPATGKPNEPPANRRTQTLNDAFIEEISELPIRRRTRTLNDAVVEEPSEPPKNNRTKTSVALASSNEIITEGGWGPTTSRREEPSTSRRTRTLSPSIDVEQYIIGHSGEPLISRRSKSTREQVTPADVDKPVMNESSEELARRQTRARVALVDIDDTLIEEPIDPVTRRPTRIRVALVDEPDDRSSLPSTTRRTRLPAVIPVNGSIRALPAFPEE